MFRTPSITPSTIHREPSIDRSFCATVVLPSRVDVHAVAAISDEINEAFRHHVDSIVIDATSVKHLDQVGIDTLCTLREDIEARQLSFRIIASPTLRVAVELTGSGLLAWPSNHITPVMTESELVAA